MMTLPIDFHTQLKRAAAKAHVTLKGFVIEAIRVAIEKEEAKKN